MAVQDKMYQTPPRFSSTEQLVVLEPAGQRGIVPRLDSIALKVDSSIRLTGIGLYGDNGWNYETVMRIIEGKYKAVEISSAPILCQFVQAWESENGVEQSSALHQSCSRHL